MSQKDTLDALISTVNTFMSTTADAIVELKAKNAQTEDVDLQPEIDSLTQGMNQAIAKINPIAQDAGATPIETPASNASVTDQPAS